MLMDDVQPSQDPPHPDVAALRARVAQQEQELQGLRGALERARSALEVAGASMWDHDLRTGQITRPFNLTFGANLPAGSLGSSFTAFLNAVHPDDRPALTQAIERVVKEHAPLDVEFRVVVPDGSVRWRASRARLMRDADGQPAVLCGVGLDITQQKLAEEALRTSEERFRQLAENIEEVFWMNNLEQTRMLYISPAYERVWGRSCESLYQSPRSFLDAVHPEDRERVIRLLELQRVTGEIDMEYRIVRPDGTIRHIHDRGFPIRDASGHVYRVAGIAVDVTQLKQADEALRQARDQLEVEVRKRTADLARAEEKYRGIFENATEGIFQTTPDGRYLSANPALARLDGHDSPAELMAAINDIGAQLYVDPGRRAEFIRLLETQGVVKDFESQIRRKDGRVIWVSENARAVRDSQGRTLHYEGTVQDITERKRLEDQLRQSQKMEAIGRLAGGVAHDFNNLLTGIIGYTDLLMNSCTPDNPLYEDLLQIRRAGERAAALTGQLLAFSRRQMMTPRTLDLNGIIADMGRMLRRLLGEDVELITQLAPDLGKVRADPGQIEQVLLNLAVNARDAMPDGGRLTIETANVELDERLGGPEPGGQGGPHVLIVVSDTGCGMDEQTLAHLFEPFFTTKEVGKGTGLGLATTYGIIKQSDGHIGVFSRPGHGTTFKIYLPRHEEAPRLGRRTAPSFQLTSGSETILLAEDEELVRKLARLALEASGYTVLVADNGAEALRLATGHTGRIHLLVADVVMPKMGGRILAQELVRLRPETKVLFLSGYTDDEVLRQGIHEAEAAFLQKPFTPDGLAQKVREVLDR
jgi:PAS domain S-box-containing protein